MSKNYNIITNEDLDKAIQQFITKEEGYNYAFTRNIVNRTCMMSEEFDQIFRLSQYRVRLHEEIKPLFDKNREAAVQKLQEFVNELMESNVLTQQFVAGLGGNYDKGTVTNLEEKLMFMIFDDERNKITDCRLFCALYKNYKSYPNPGQYMERLVYRLSTDEERKTWGNDSLRLRILKKFSTCCEGLKKSGYGSSIKTLQKYASGIAGVEKVGYAEIAANLTEPIFDLLVGAKADEKQADGKYGLLRIVDELASGTFRKGVATKKALYMFAMVYDMTYYTGNQRQIISYDSDVGKNLFVDYYNNNFLRFLTSNIYDGVESGGYDLDPVGEGINYKNFAEVIYCYFISREGLSANEKLMQSAAMIDDAIKGSDCQNNTKVPKQTIEYNNIILQGDGAELFSKADYDGDNDYKKFLNFIVRNYDRGGKQHTALTINADHMTAFSLYNALVERISPIIENCNFGIWFTDISAGIDEVQIEAICRSLQISREEFRAFQRLLLRINNYIGFTNDGGAVQVGAERGKVKVLNIKKASEMTRGALLTAHYYYYLMKHEQEDLFENSNFGCFFKKYKQDVDKYLSVSNYNKLSMKNFFDAIIVLSAYFYLNSLL